jgi:hypothetical protein
MRSARAFRHFPVLYRPDFQVRLISPTRRDADALPSGGRSRSRGPVPGLPAPAIGIGRSSDQRARGVASCGVLLRVRESVAQEGVEPGSMDRKRAAAFILDQPKLLEFKPAPPQERQPGEHLWAIRKDGQQLDCDLRDHRPWGRTPARVQPVGRPVGRGEFSAKFEWPRSASRGCSSDRVRVSALVSLREYARRTFGFSPRVGY